MTTRPAARHSRLLHSNAAKTTPRRKNLMTKMFPDSGVPPADAINSLPDVDTKGGCDELWYSTSRCQPRFDPAAANAMLAEDMNLVMKGEVTYDCTTQTNLELAVRYLIQRGLPNCSMWQAGPYNYVTS